MAAFEKSSRAKFEMADLDIPFDPQELDHRYRNIKTSLEKSRNAVSSKEDRDIKQFQNDLSSLRKFLQDCQHRRRGLSDPKVLFYLNDCLEWLEVWELTSADEYIDLLSDRKLLLSKVDQPSEFPADTTAPSEATVQPPASENVKESLYSPGDIVVVTDSIDDGCSSSFAAEVVSATPESLTVKRKGDDDSLKGPLAFSGTDHVNVSGDDAISGRVSFAMQHLLYKDQYKFLFWHPDMKIGDCQYYLRVKHTLCGDLLFGQVVELNGSDYVFGGAVDRESSKPPRHQKAREVLLLPNKETSNPKLITVPLTKDVREHPGPKYPSAETLSQLLALLTAIVDRKVVATKTTAIQVPEKKSG
jgi:hypothetical protein